MQALLRRRVLWHILKCFPPVPFGKPKEIFLCYLLWESAAVLKSQHCWGPFCDWVPLEFLALRVVCTDIFYSYMYLNYSQFIQFYQSFLFYLISTLILILLLQPYTGILFSYVLGHFCSFGDKLTILAFS